MNVFIEVLRELAKMFFGEPRLAIPIVVLVTLALATAHYIAPVVGAALLPIGCVGLLAENVLSAERRNRR